MAKIMVTDDVGFIRGMLKEIMEEAGHEVVEACSGEEMLDLYEQDHPDIVFLDIFMSDNGMDTLTRMMKKHPEAKIVICSAIGGMEYVAEEAVQKGAVACIRKPFRVDSVLEAIQLCLERDA